MKIAKLDEYDFDNYSKNHKYHTYYQTSSYGKLMENYGLKPLYLGFFNDNELVGATLILAKSVLMGFKYGYAPRGLLIDYDQYYQLIDIAQSLKNYLFKEKYILLKIDPLLLITTRDKDGNILYSCEHKENIMNAFKDASFYHCGFNRSFESVKPRWLANLSLGHNPDEIFKAFSKQIRNKIRKATKLGVEIYKDFDKLEDIYPFIEKNKKYSLKYYKDFQEYFKNNIELYVAKLNTEQYVEGSRLLYEKELEYNDYLNNIISRDGYKGKNMKDILSKKMESDKLLIIYKDYLVKSIELLKKYPTGVIIGATIIIKENDTIRLLIDGYDKDYGNLCPLYLIKWEIIKEYSNSKYKNFDLNAITGIFDEEINKFKGLNELKFGFGALAHEYIGEFNLIINSPMYTLYKSVLNNDSMKNIAK